MTKTNLAYIAGLFDGEGSIHVAHQKAPRVQNPNHRVHVLSINITNTNKECIDFIFNTFNFGYVQTKKISNSNHKTLYIWSVRCLKAGKFLSVIFPYLIIKKEIAKIALEFQKRISKGNHQAYEDKSWQKEYCQKIRIVSFEKGTSKIFRILC